MHVAIYIVILGMVASGIGMMVLSGAAPDVFGGSGTLSNFHDYLLRVPHGLGDKSLLFALLAAHIGAALYHYFIRGDGLLRRMWYSC